MVLTASQQALADAMSKTSQFCYFASWMSMTEFRLWQFMTDPNDDGDWGSRPIPQEVRDELRALSDGAGGWIYWNDEADVSSEEHGTTFAPIGQWLDMVADWQGRMRQDPQLPRRYVDYPEWFARQTKGKEQGED